MPDNKSIDNQKYDDLDPETIDTGEPIPQLVDLEVAPSKGFMGRLRTRIERRKLGADFTGLIWHAPVAVIVEFLDVLFQLMGLSSKSTTDETDSDSES